MDLPKIYEHFLKSTGVCTDTRKLDPGQLFVALKGPSFNGNQFAEQALAAGASAVIVDEDLDLASDKRVIQVEDGLLTIQALAAFHRQQFDIPVLGITGSNGKTTNKELIHAVLSTRFKTHFTKGNLNNHIGVPLTLLELDQNHEFAIVEMGANHVGEIHELSLISRPNHGLITSIGLAHLEGFGSVEGIRQGKGELYRFVASHDGLCFVHRGLDDIESIFQTCGSSKAVFYGGANDHLHIESVTQSPMVSVQVAWGEKRIQIDSQLLGRFQADNILHAVAVGLHFEVPIPDIQSAIAAYKAENNRAQLIQQEDNQINLDAYNANPSSMRAALTGLIEKESDRPKMAILGDMFELGAESLRYHQEIVDLASDERLEQVILVGNDFGRTNRPEHFMYFKDVSAAKEWWQNEDVHGYDILIKGSRGIALEKLLKGH